MRLKKFIPENPPEIYFDYQLPGEDGALLSVPRGEYVEHYLTEFVSELSDLVATGDMTVEKVKAHLLDRLYEFADDRVDDALLNQDISGIIRYLRAVDSSEKPISIEEFENFESKLYRAVTKQLEK